MVAQDLRDRFSELSFVKDDKINYWINKSTKVFNISRWGDSYEEGLLNWIAHNIATQIKYSEDKDLIDPSDGLNILMPLVGSSQNKSTRDLVVLQAKDPFMGTIYGQEYRRLSRLIGKVGISA